MDIRNEPQKYFPVPERPEMRINLLQYKPLMLSLLLAMLAEVGSLSAACDVYFITYATRDGNTGHSALAVDNYLIIVKDRIGNETIVHEYDTIKTGTLTYFDFWPEKDHFSIRNVGKDTRAKYNKLPAATYEKEISLDYIMNHGIPHIKNSPCDGILLLETSPGEDYKLIHFMDSIINLNRPFNVRKYNCSDFIRAGASYVTGMKIRANEFIPFSFSTTPNRLYKKLRSLDGIQVVLDPGKKVDGLFFKERVLEIFINRKSS